MICFSKPQVFEAIRFNGFNCEDVQRLLPKTSFWQGHSDSDKAYLVFYKSQIEVVFQGDWIIKSPNGHPMVLSHSDFEKHFITPKQSIMWSFQ